MFDHDICVLSVKSDAETAEKLAASIAAYRLPKNTALPDPELDYRRIILDTDETPFGDTVAERLNACRFLVLICSPETKNNPAILGRLAWFRQIRNNENIVAVIAAGEPVDSFPESFIEKKTVRRILPDMSVVERVETIEPIASDLRASNPAQWRRMLHYETVRIVASVLGLHPDALEQRHRQRRKRALITALSIVGAACLIAAGIFLRLGFIAKNEGDIAAEQTRLSVEIAQRTMVQLPESFAGEEQALDYIDEAIGNARSSLDEIGLGSLLDDAAAEDAG